MMAVASTTKTPTAATRVLSRGALIVNTGQVKML